MAVLLSSVAVAGGCRPGERGGETSAEPAVDERLLAYLSIARAKHHEANLYEGDNRPEEAARSLEALLRIKPPDFGQKAMEVEEVLADTHTRLAELRLRMGDVDGAWRDVEEGTKMARPGSYFHGHLLEVAGIVEEARARGLADAGRVEEANAARIRAREKLREAVKIQEKVIERALSDGG